MTDVDTNMARFLLTKLSLLIFYGLKDVHDCTDRRLRHDIHQVNSFMTTFKHKKGCQMDYFRHFSKFLSDFCQLNDHCRSFTALSMHIITLKHCKDIMLFKPIHLLRHSKIYRLPNHLFSQIFLHF